MQPTFLRRVIKKSLEYMGPPAAGERVDRYSAGTPWQENRAWGAREHAEGLPHMVDALPAAGRA
jgi:hypothetical protein